MSKRPGKYHFAVVNYLYLLFSFVKLGNAAPPPKKIEFSQDLGGNFKILDGLNGSSFMKKLK